MVVDGRSTGAIVPAASTTTAERKHDRRPGDPDRPDGYLEGGADPLGDGAALGF
jgi:hypothetical protein